MATLAPPPPLDPKKIALFLDVDGTLVEIERHPDAVHVPDELRRTLERLERVVSGALAVVSGRGLDQVDRLFRPLTLSVAGLHGLERRRPDGSMVRATPAPAAYERARSRLERFAARAEGLLLEDKGLTLALHYRNAPECAAEAEAEARAVAAESDGAFVLLAGKMVLELKPPGADKGHAIEDFMQEPPFAGRTPVFAGDDVTDEAGFQVVRELGGVAIRIGDDGRATAAAFGLKDVPAARRWLEELAEEGRGGTFD